MEKRLNKKLEVFMIEFKENISKKAAELQTQAQQSNNTVQHGKNDNILSSLVQYIYDYQRITFTKEDVEKRKRAKNIVPLCERCIAKRATNVQCTRKKKDGYDYCGTHLKGTPHGLVTDNETDNETDKDNENETTEDGGENEKSVFETANGNSDKVNKKDKKKESRKVEVWAQDIQGIMHYIDKLGNVYNAEDVIRNKTNPGIIARYSKIGDKYSITSI